MKALTEEMADWIIRLRYEDLPSDVVTRAKQILLDTIGCALGALDGAPVRLAREVAQEEGGAPRAMPIGLSWRTSCEQAAFLNALAIRYLDFNDYSISGGHASIHVGPALAVAQAQGLSGKDLLLGIVIGYEVQILLQYATAKAQHDNWDHSTFVHYSAAAVAGKLLGLSSSQLAQALAIAGSHALTLAEVRRGRLSMWKGAAEPVGMRGGTFAALLAHAGLTGPLTVLEGKYGYARVLGGKLRGELLRKPPKRFHILESCIKPWPCLFVAQAPVAAALRLRARGVTADAIEKITIVLSDFGYQQQKRFMETGISTREDADHSVPYCVTRSLLDGELRLEHFEEQAFKRPEVRALIQRVVLRSDPGLPKRVGARVELKLRDGTTISERVPYPPGHARNPLSEEELSGKFFRITENLLEKGRAARASEMILHIDELAVLDPLLDALQVKPAVS
ncbi:MAG: MmgE/PrpD family protein [Deltaproteobacteria bacterium]|nr:MmgE/PrpD family protein [Deltaproteobacteria bacterium]